MHVCHRGRYRHIVTACKETRDTYVLNIAASRGTQTHIRGMRPDPDHADSDIIHNTVDDTGASGQCTPYEDAYEVWCDYFSEELVTLYHSLKDHTDAMGLALFEFMDISAFCHFAYRMSSGRKPGY